MIASQKAGQASSACPKKSSGFTLIEVMIVVAIVAILAAVAYPSYLDSIRKARRADAMDSLLYLQGLHEKWRANHVDFTSASEKFLGEYDDVIGDAVAAGSADGYYTLAVGGASAVAYTLTATATGAQASDAHCAAMTLAVSADNPRGLKGGTSADCWGN